jgi:hypothetical protein
MLEEGNLDLTSLDFGSEGHDGLEESHPCGMGALGCIGEHCIKATDMNLAWRAWRTGSPAVMIREMHATNISRIPCHSYSTTPVFDPGVIPITHPVNGPCPGHGDGSHPCLQVWFQGADPADHTCLFLPKDSQTGTFDCVARGPQARTVSPSLDSRVESPAPPAPAPPRSPPHEEESDDESNVTGSFFSS